LVVRAGGVGVDLIGVLVIGADAGAEVDHVSDRVELQRGGQIAALLSAGIGGFGEGVDLGVWRGIEAGATDQGGGSGAGGGGGGGSLLGGGLRGWPRAGCGGGRGLCLRG